MSSEVVGYARVSTWDQDPSLQRDALGSAGCDRIYTDKASGANTDRPQLRAALEHLREGDILAVWRLDRLGRSLSDLITIVTELEARGVGFRSLQESIDTTTSGGRLVFHFFAALAEYERTLIRERTSAGLAAARKRGRVGGRRRVIDAKKLAVARTMYDSRDYTLKEIADTLGVGRTSVYRYLKDAGAIGEVTA